MILLQETVTNHIRGGYLTLTKAVGSVNMTGGAGTQDVTGFIPAGAMMETYLAIVDTILAGSGMTTWSVGTSGDTNRYGATLPLAAGTTVKPSDYAGDWSPTWGGAARDIRFTSAVGNFTTGVIRHELLYLTASALHAV